MAANVKDFSSEVAALAPLENNRHRNMKICTVTRETNHFLIDIAGVEHRFHFFWLRDNCPKCRNSNGQRLHESNRIDLNVSPVSFDHSDDELNIEWNDDAWSVFPVEYLQQWAYDLSREQRKAPVHWGADIRNTISWHDFDAVYSDAPARAAWLSDVDRYGFSLLRNVSPNENKVSDVVALFGFIRETHYGRLFDVRTEEKPENLAYTPVPLSVHTDNPYRDPSPTLQVLHCLIPAEKGGATVLVDGFFAAEKLKMENPAAFKILSSNDVCFHYRSNEAWLDNYAPIIQLDSAGNVLKVRINNRSLAPLQLEFDLVMPFYESLFEFRQRLEDETSQYQFRLQAGEVVVLDNERILHGRLGESIGERHLQGCYADRDGLLSTLRILEANA